MTFTHALSTNNYGPAKFIVDSSAANGTHTTIAAALTSASSGDTIFIRPGTYTENLTLKAGVDLVAFNGDQSTPNVTIIGKCSFSSAGTVSIGNIRLQTNSDFVLAVTGSVASIVNLNNCYIDCTNNTGISFTSSSSSSIINLRYCIGNLGTTGIAVYTQSSTGFLNINYCTFNNSGSSTTQSTNSAGQVAINYSNFLCVVATSSTGTFITGNSFIESGGAGALNATALTTSGTGACAADKTTFASGTASAISLGSGTTINMYNCSISSSNTNAITGAGTISYNNISFIGTSYGNNVTNQSRLWIDGGQYKGKTTNTAPDAGMIGEQISSVIALASAVALTSTVSANVTSINLTPGIWNIVALGIFHATGAISGATQSSLSISATSATGGTTGDSKIDTPTVPVNAGPDLGLTIPAYRVSLSANTTYFLVALGIGSVSYNASAYGRISATRVA
jgi:hypothetical protein